MIALILLAAAPEAIAPWSLRCYRDGDLAGRAFELCRARATTGAASVSFDRDAQGLVGVVEGCKTQAKGIFRLSPRALAGPKRAARFDSAVATALRQCGLQPLVPAPGATETLLHDSDGLSPDWVG